VRKHASRAVVVAVGAIALVAAVAALVDAEPASAEQSQTARATPAQSAGARHPSVPPCEASQLHFRIDVIDAPVAVLEHVRGASCREPDRSLQVDVRGASTRGGGILFGPGGNLDGTFSPSVEKRAAFRYRPTCGEHGLFLAIARRGSFLARRRIPVEPRCVPLRVRGVIRLAPGPDEGYVAFWAPDPAAHAFSVRMSMPRRALAASLELPSLTLSLHRRFSTVGCRRRGTNETCIFHYPLLPAESSGRWVVFVRKTSAEPATVRFRIAFEAVR
jgi:hypothetical protein